MAKSSSLTTVVGLVVSIFLLPAIVNSHREIEVVHAGEACECRSKLPYHVETPAIPACRDSHYDYGYKIIRQEENPAECKYSFDFQLEHPKENKHNKL